MDTAKVFWTGRSQAIRLPKSFRFDANEVRIRRHGTQVILEPVPNSWDWLAPLIGPLDAEFERAATEQPIEQTRAGLDVFQ
ncbi:MULTISPECIES: type II toxin-antitoxin system VapB family antitoxin [Burkholderiaceae]|jgi:antitoxin VapB|uniref:antitoxin n=1 Tax=Burkholderiaceae TaxID=119060 RepID=UPI00095E2A19|nr:MULTISPECIES: type II toxin-antitoxin system VapB family antitoxin [Burkholderiaceae]MCG1041005.1 AbrB/MazE/SpoVT family DNA-binding domain-containing protein [Mycetohabitans sp. B7]SIT64849.1 antitoxin VapB [Burkholderia sp. b14]